VSASRLSRHNSFVWDFVSRFLAIHQHHRAVPHLTRYLNSSSLRDPLLLYVALINFWPVVEFNPSLGFPHVSEWWRLTCTFQSGSSTPSASHTDHVRIPAFAGASQRCSLIPSLHSPLLFLRPQTCSGIPQPKRYLHHYQSLCIWLVSLGCELTYRVRYKLRDRELVVVCPLGLDLKDACLSWKGRSTLEYSAGILWIALLDIRRKEWPGVATIIDHDRLSGPLGIETDVELLA